MIRKKIMTVCFVCVTMLAISKGFAEEQKSITFSTTGASFWSACRGDKTIGILLKSEGYIVKQIILGGSNPKGYKYKKIIEAKEFDKLPKSLRKSAKNRERIIEHFSKLEKGLLKKPTYVLFQAHSSWPFSDNPISSANEYIKYLKKKSPKSTFIACMTWIKQSNRSQDKWDKVIKCYKAIEKENNILMAPSGTAFMIVNKERPDIKLYRTHKDGHPSVRGQYLNSCVVYSIMTDKSPVGLIFDIPSVSCSKTGEKMVLKPEVADYLQKVAWRVVQAKKTGSEIEIKSNNIEIEKIIYVCNYNNQNKIISKKKLIKNKVEQIIDYKYKNNLLKEEIVKNSFDQIISSKIYVYKNTILQSIIYKDANNNIAGTDVFKYKKGILTEYMNINKLKEMTEKETYEYKNGKRQQKNLFSANGSKCGTTKYKYKNGVLAEKIKNIDNNQIKITYMYNGKTTEINTIVNENIIAKEIIKYDHKEQLLFNEHYQIREEKLTLIKNINFKNRY